MPKRSSACWRASSDTEARIVRMYHLEGKPYQEISSAVGVPENSIGPILSRARSKMRAESTPPPLRELPSQQQL